MPKSHPTKELLIETAVQLIDEFGPQGFTVDVLLEKSKISKGSLYHHFTDFGDVIEQAQVARFGRSVDEDAEQLVALLMSSTSLDDMFSKIHLLVSNATGESRAKVRLDRAAVIGGARHSEKFAQALSVEQQRLTDAFADLIHELQNRGWISQQVDPRAAGTFIQAYSLGYVLNDITASPISSDAWTQIVESVIRSLFTAK